jgi:hypothetical protein
MCRDVLHRRPADSVGTVAATPVRDGLEEEAIQKRALPQTALTRRDMLTAAMSLAASTAPVACQRRGPAAGTEAPRPAQLAGKLVYMDWELSTDEARQRWERHKARFLEKVPSGDHRGDPHQRVLAEAAGDGGKRHPA